MASVVHDPERDPFAKAVGERRGLTDVRAALERTAEAEHALEQAQDVAQALREQRDHLHEVIKRRDDSLKVQENEIFELCTDNLECRCELDRARYALVRATGAEALVGSRPAVHHREWTPGRPYLCGDHVYSPADGACYQAPPYGVAAGELPGVSEAWVLCGEGATCPKPEPLPRRGHPMSCRHALRQDQFWTDAEERELGLSELTDEHLQGAIAWLDEHARQLWTEELHTLSFYVPCPAQAYPDHISWLADTPLMRALRQELTRRGLPATEHATALTTASTSKSTPKRKDLS